jgi:hypothetical protein
VSFGRDLFGWVACWVPLSGRLEVAALGVQRDRGAAGTLDAWVVRQGPRSHRRWAIVWVGSGGHLHGGRGVRQASNPRDPMVDHEAIAAVAGWGSRRAALAEVQ